ncbi:hypothetical protein [Methylobacterium sp. JK268]
MGRHRVAIAAVLALAVLTCAILAADPARAREDLLARWERADAVCGLPASVMTEQACLDRARFAAGLHRAGWCEAPPTSPYEHWGWRPCAARASAPHPRERRGARG